MLAAMVPLAVESRWLRDERDEQHHDEREQDEHRSDERDVDED